MLEIVCLQKRIFAIKWKIAVTKLSYRSITCICWYIMLVNEKIYVKIAFHEQSDNSAAVCTRKNVNGQRKSIVTSHNENGFCVGVSRPSFTKMEEAAALFLSLCRNFVRPRWNLLRNMKHLFHKATYVRYNSSEKNTT